MSKPGADLAEALPVTWMYRHRIVPLGVEDGVLRVGAVIEPEPAVLRDLAFLTGKTVVSVPVGRAEVDAFVRAYEPEEEVEAVPADVPVQRLMPRGGMSGSGSVVEQVDRLILAAIEQKASDVHIEPYEHVFRVRYRLDGVLHTVEELSLLQRDAIISRLKIMASLDIAERRRPQDGRIRFPVGEQMVDLRVSTLPTDFGEKVVLRILDKSHLRLDLEALGFDEAALAAFRRAIRLPYGMILVTGPTGSGKTTTLYAALNALNTQEVNITTIEDPIEYNLPGINQTHVRSDIGFTFAQTLRAFLRQDPNVIMVGEIRDTETAVIAVRAALTGHLVLSTLHTNDAPSAVTRLIDMGVEPFLVASSVRLVVAQRLVRRICEACREPGTFDAALRAELQIDGDGSACFRGRGCAACSGTGYRGRTALFEVMPVDEALAGLIARRAGLYDIRRHAHARGMQTLREVALARMRAGITTPEEVLRETTI